MKEKSPVMDMCKRVWSVVQLRMGLIFLLILIILAVIGPKIAPHDPMVLNDEILSPPGKDYLLGTDQYGRDLFSRILYGIKTSLIIGFVAASISGIVGTILGAIAGFWGGVIDQALTFLTNILTMTPSFFLILIVIALFGSSINNVIVVIGLTTWALNFRLMRTQAVSLRDRNFVKGAMTIGENRWQILLRHVIPNAIFPVIVNTTMQISSSILYEASLAFLGLGDPNIISWGQIVSDGKGLLSNGWWVATFSGIAIVFCVWTFFLLGDGLNRLLTPKLHKSN